MRFFVEVTRSPVFSFQLIADCDPFFRGGIQFAFCLRQKLNYLRKHTLKRSLESSAFAPGYKSEYYCFMLSRFGIGGHRGVGSAGGC